MNVASLRMTRDGGRAAYSAAGREGEREAPALKGIAPVCDTVAEASDALKASRNNHRAMKECERLAKDRLAALDGKALEDRPEAGPMPWRV